MVEISSSGSGEGPGSGNRPAYSTTLFSQAASEIILMVQSGELDGQRPAVASRQGTRPAVPGLHDAFDR